MAVTQIGDPRLQELFGASDPRDPDVRPSVRLPRKSLPPLALAAALLMVGLVLFFALNSRRTGQAEPRVRPGAAASGAAAWPAPPPLYVPPVPPPANVTVAPVEMQAETAKAQPVPLAAPGARPAPPVAYAPQPVPQMAPPPIPIQQPRVSAGAPLVIDTGGVAGGAAAQQGAASLPGTFGQAGARMRASALANRSTTVPQGTLIPAVLETGFDSTQAGFARAIVSRDVRSFDASNVLIPRGSRLIGDYRSDVAPGQKRAVIVWTRLIRPDGMTITIDSPAVDPVGRGGVPASVDTHFFERLGDAILQSTVGLGTALAQRSANGTVVVVPGAGQAAGQLTPTRTYAPTLSVRPGTSISIFVAHDLDFSAAGQER